MKNDYFNHLPLLVVINTPLNIKEKNLKKYKQKVINSLKEAKIEAHYDIIVDICLVDSSNCLGDTLID